MTSVIKANDDAEEEEELFLYEVPLKVLSNEKRIQGSICLLYPDVLDNLAHKEGHNLYIIPKHEVINNKRNYTSIYKIG